MPTQAFKCRVHGEFDRDFSFSQDIPPSLPCLVDVCIVLPPNTSAVVCCGEDSPWVPQVVPTIWKCSK